jgi:hypothetical protein
MIRGHICAGNFRDVCREVFFADEYIFLSDVLNTKDLIGCRGEIVSVRRLREVMAVSGCSLGVDGKNISK